MEHRDFILQPITNILDEAISAVKLLGGGMQTNPLMNYLFHSIFLQMTGAQEQKLKCICWEVATINYDFRYLWLSKKKEGDIGECSEYDDKIKVYNLLLRQLGEDKDANIKTKYKKEKDALLTETLQIVDELGRQEIFKPAESKHADFLEFAKQVSADNLMLPETLFGEKKVCGKTIKDIYVDKLYRQRNKNAHNTSSYQTNVPSFSQLSDKESFYDNYYIYFYLLALIDGMIRILFEEWCKNIY